MSSSSGKFKKNKKNKKIQLLPLSNFSKVLAGSIRCHCQGREGWQGGTGPCGMGTASLRHPAPSPAPARAWACIRLGGSPGAEAGEPRPPRSHRLAKLSRCPRPSPRFPVRPRGGFFPSALQTSAGANWEAAAGSLSRNPTSARVVSSPAEAKRESCEFSGALRTSSPKPDGQFAQTS